MNAIARLWQLRWGRCHWCLRRSVASVEVIDPCADANERAAVNGRECLKHATELGPQNCDDCGKQYALILWDEAIRPSGKPDQWPTGDSLGTGSFIACEGGPLHGRQFDDSMWRLLRATAAVEPLGSEALTYDLDVVVNGVAHGDVIEVWRWRDGAHTSSLLEPVSPNRDWFAPVQPLQLAGAAS